MKPIRIKTVILLVFGIIGVWLIIRFCDAYIRITNARACFNRGYASLKSKNYDEAIEYLSKSIHYKMSSLAYESRGIAFYEVNRMDEAIDDYAAAIHLNPTYEDAYYNRGLAYSKKGDFDRARQDFDKAIQLKPRDFWAFQSRGMAYLELNRLDEAIRDFSESLHLNQTNAGAYHNRGLAYFAEGDLDQAISDYSSAIRLSSENENIYRDRGWSYYFKSNWLNAIKDFEYAVWLYPADGLACNNYAWLLATCPDSSVRNGAVAVKLALMACESTKWSTWICVDTLAAAYAEAGDFSNAIKYQIQAISMAGFSEERTNLQRRLDLYYQKKAYFEAPQLNSRIQQSPKKFRLLDTPTNSIVIPTQ